MNLPDAPIAHEGFFATHFFTVKDQKKSKHFYVRILGGKVIKPMVARLHFDIPKAPPRSRQLLEIQRFSNGEVVFRITGRLQAENLPEREHVYEFDKRIERAGVLKGSFTDPISNESCQVPWLSLEPILVDFQRPDLRFQGRTWHAQFGCGAQRSEYPSLAFSQSCFD